MACHSKSLSSFVSGLASTLAVAVPVLLLAALLSVAPLPSVALAEDEPEYLALGDSITWGYEPGGGQLGDECFVSLLAAGKGYSFANEGVVGNTASGILDQLDSGELDGKVAAARVITITCGGNDLMRLVYEKTAALYNKTYPSQPISADDVTTILSNPEDPRYNTVRLDAYYVIAYTKIDESEEFAAALDTFVSNLNQVTARIRALSPDARVYVSTQYNPYEHFSGAG